MIVVDGKYPIDCLHCDYRKVIYVNDKDVNDKHYQMCSLCTDGYKVESWFKDKDLVDGFKAKECPISCEFEDAFKHELLITDMDYIMEIKENDKL